MIVAAVDSSFWYVIRDGLARDGGVGGAKLRMAFDIARLTWCSLVLRVRFTSPPEVEPGAVRLSTWGRDYGDEGLVLLPLKIERTGRGADTRRIYEARASRVRSGMTAVAKGAAAWRSGKSSSAGSGRLK